MHHTPSHLHRLALCAALIALVVSTLHNSPAAIAQADTAQKPFILPFQQPPGPDTWLLAQPYGNTAGAYRQRNTTYRNSGGIHFGVDFSAPCGTELVAMADGIVFAVDNLRFGSAPHNLMIDHPDLGYATFYGHLLQPPSLRPGQQVKAGEIIALTGDPAETCNGRPHLHLEIRNLAHVRKYNPVLLVQAEWDNLALIGPFGQAFEYDLDSPRQWQHLNDQPEATAGGPLLNDFTNPWPPDASATSSPPKGETGAAPEAGTIPAADAAPALAPPSAPGLLRQLTTGGCCTQPFWSPDSRQVLYIDRPSSARPAGIWGTDATRPFTPPQLFAGRIAFYSPDMAYRIELTGSATIIEQLADPTRGTTGTRWVVATGGRPVSISPGHKRIAWQVSNENVPFERSRVAVWVANLDGSEARKVTTLPRGGLNGWISDDVLLVSGRESLDAREQVLYALSINDDSRTELARSDRLRGGLIAPGGLWLTYFVAMSEDRTQDGLWLVRTDGGERRQLPRELFGSYRWRDADRLLIIPLRPDAAFHELWELNVASGAVRQLTDPGATQFRVANNDWAVSPDGRQIAFVESRDHNIWLLSLPE